MISCPPSPRDTGSERATATADQLTSQISVVTSKDNRKNVQPPRDSTGSLSQTLANHKDSQQLEANSVPDTGNPPDLKRQKLMSGKKTRGSLVPNSSLEAARFNAILKRIGIKYDNMLKEESLSLYPVTYIYGKYRLNIDIIGLSPLSLQIIPELLETKKKWWFFTEELGVESLGELGTRQVWRLTLKIHDPNGGMATGVKSMLLSMNFVELLTFHTFLDGSTVIRCVLRDHLLCFCVGSSRNSRTSFVDRFRNFFDSFFCNRSCSDAKKFSDRLFCSFY